MENSNETSLVTINPAEYGLQENEAQQISAFFIPMLDKMKELELEFNEVVKMPLEPSTFQKAKELRLKYVKVRTGTADIHKKAKDYYLKGGRFVDGWKNAQALASHGKEETLEKIEKHYEIMEAERKANLKAERLELISDLCENPEMYPLGEMSEAAFKQLFDGFVLAKQQKEEAERKAEEERIENERLNKLENERRIEIAPYVQFATGSNDLRNMPDDEYEKLLSSLKSAKNEYEAEQEKIRQENERLRIEAEKKEKELQAERDRIEKEREVERQKQAKIRAELKAKADAERKEKERIEAELKAKQAKILAEQKAEAERLAKIEAEKQAKIQAELKEKADAERKEKERIEAELKAKQEKELAEQKEKELTEKKRIEEEKKAAKAPVKEKLTKWVNSFSIEIPDSELLNNEIALNIKAKFDAFKKWAKSEIEKL